MISQTERTHNHPSNFRPGCRIFNDLRVVCRSQMRGCLLKFWWLISVCLAFTRAVVMKNISICGDQLTRRVRRAILCCNQNRYLKKTWFENKMPTAFLECQNCSSKIILPRSDGAFNSISLLIPWTSIDSLRMSYGEQSFQQWGSFCFFSEELFWSCLITIKILFAFKASANICGTSSYQCGFSSFADFTL